MLTPLELKFTILALKTSGHMAGKVKRMSQIKQLLIMHRDGLGRKAIARALSMSKNTVKSYLEKVKALVNGEDSAITLEGLIALEEYKLEQVFHSGNPAYKDGSRYDVLIGHMDYFRHQLKLKGVNRKVLWEEFLGVNHGMQPVVADGRAFVMAAKEPKSGVFEKEVFLTAYALSPNPTGGLARLTLAFDQPADVRLQLLNLLGQAVWEANFSRTMQVAENIDLQVQPDGLYLLQITREGQTKTMKLIKSARR
jgi:hypothetical protein